MSSTFIKSVPVPVGSIPKAGPELSDYLTNVVTEAYSLINTLDSPSKDPWNFHFKKSNKFGEVEVSSRNHQIEEGTEYWFARRSVHELVGESKEGKEHLRWDDFKNFLFYDHSENEREYGPSVCQLDILDIERDAPNISVPGWEVVRVAAYAVHHHLPWPLKRRVFPVLLVLASAIDKKEFMVISLPISLPEGTKGKNTKNQEFGLVISSKVTVGQYVSVEKVEYQQPQSKDGNPNVVWSMATASDASGNLPMALQRRVIGTSIFGDVGAFLEYVAKQKAA